MTTPVVARTCGQDGHVTRFISACNSSTYVLVSCGHFANSIEFLPTSPNDQYSFRGFDLEHLEPTGSCRGSPAGVITIHRASLAGAEGFEPPLAVLETAGLAVKPMPLRSSFLTQPTRNQKLSAASTGARPNSLLGLAVRLMLSAIRAELLQLQPLGCGFLILRIAIVPILAFLALKLNNLARHPALLVLKFPRLNLRTLVAQASACETHSLKAVPHCYSTISATVPAPTVRPPSRIAN